MSITNLVPSGYYTNDVKNYATPQEWEQALRAISEGGTIKIPCMGDIYTFRMVGKGQDRLANNNAGSDLTSFICEELYAGSTFNMNFTNTNESGWHQSAGREFIHSLLFTFPEALQAAIKTVIKKSSVGNRGNTIVSTYDKLWIPSATELYGNPPANNFATEGIQYKYYKNAGVTVGNSLLLGKKVLNGSGTTYWLRSPYLESNLYFGIINFRQGELNCTYASGLNRACVGFCV